MLNATLDGGIGTPDLLANPIHIRITKEDNLPTKNKMIEQAWTRHGERYLDRNCDTMFVCDDSGLARAISSAFISVKRIVLHLEAAAGFVQSRGTASLP